MARIPLNLSILTLPQVPIGMSRLYLNEYRIEFKLAYQKSSVQYIGVAGVRNQCA